MATIVHQNRLFKVERIKVPLRNGKGKKDAFIVDKPSEVGIIPLLGDNIIVMERQHRPAVGKTLYEIPLGHIEPGERPRAAALRELEEETGFKAGKLKYIGVFYTSPGFLTSRSYLYVATGLKKGMTNLDEDEILEVKRMKLGDLERMVKSNRIQCAKTALALLYYLNFRRR